MLSSFANTEAWKRRSLTDYCYHYSQRELPTSLKEDDVCDVIASESKCPDLNNQKQI